MPKKVKSKAKQRKRQKRIRSMLPFLIIGLAITGFISYLWTYTEVDETLKELDLQRATIIELNDEISKLKSDIDHFSRVDIITTRAKNDLGMVFAPPETIAVYVDDLVESTQ